MDFDDILRGIYSVTPEQREAARLNEIEAAILNRDDLDDAVKVINHEFSIDGVPTITKQDVRFRLQFIGDWGLSGSSLAQGLFNTFFPRANLQTYSHYRSLSGFEKIVKNKKLRFYSLVKNFSLEFQQFYFDHDMDGYFKKIHTPTGKPYIEYLMSELFSLCLTGDVNKETTNYCWTNFSKGGHGVKLIFEINSISPDFRKIMYRERRTGFIPSIKNLNQYFLNKYNRHFLFTQTSKFGAFYINNSLSVENEYRFLIKKYTDDYGFASDIKLDEELTRKRGKEIHYIEEDFINPYGEFILKQVQPGPYCSLIEVKRILDEAGLFDVEVLPNYLENEYEGR